MDYNHIEIEKKWQKFWEEKELYKCNTLDSKPKYYVLDMFPYPSGDGLHVGHPRGYTATDVIARYKRMNGFNVLHPVGWDSFGLPAEQYAIRTGTHPEITTKKNIQRFTNQMKSLGLSYDWSREIATSDPKYYKWTQWIFKKLYEKDLAYVAELPVNWCPELGTVLSNEEVIDGKSEVGGFPVIRKSVRQWGLKITKYAERLLEDLNLLDWPESTIEMQRNWIGKSIGAEVIFTIENFNYEISVFTTRVDTLFGCSYVVLAAEHPLVKKIVSSEKVNEVNSYIEKTSLKSELERTELNKEKSGVFIGAYAVNPINNKKVPIYIADYVLASYGSGAVMAVPAHDERDFEFAHKYHLEIIKVLECDILDQAFTGDGKHINSDFADGLNISDSKEVILKKLIELGKGKEKVNYKLRDWIFSRQRFWGEPIPVVHLENGEMVLVPDDELPLVLPNIKNFQPSGTGESPLVNAGDWLEVNIDGQKGKRETNTMPQWAGSCWYYLRYLDPDNTDEIANKKILDKWLPVDLYIGGAEHAVGHLIYARFWHKVLFDLGLVSSQEPFKKVFHQGMILGENNEKMSKSRGNVINPDPLVEKYGADSLRLYEMFMGPLDSFLPWSVSSFEGCRRFLDRVYRLFTEPAYTSKFSKNNSGELDKIFHRSVQKITNDINNMQFNTAISQLMSFINESYKSESIYLSYLNGFLKMLAPFAPHLSSELWQALGNETILDFETWPIYEEKYLIDNEIDLPIQVNGKLRGTLKVAIDYQEEDIKAKSLEISSVKAQLEGKTIIKIIHIKNKIFNIVCK